MAGWRSRPNRWAMIRRRLAPVVAVAIVAAVGSVTEAPAATATSAGPAGVAGAVAAASDPITLGDEDVVPLVPARLLDTRDGTGLPAGVPHTVGAGQTINLTVTGRGGVSATGVSAVVLNVTATQPSASSYVTVWPKGETRPLASNLNIAANQTIPNLVVAKVGAGGQVSLYNNNGSTHLVADVARAAPGEQRLQPVGAGPLVGHP